MGKVNSITAEQRIERVLELLGEGYFTFQLVAILKAEWGIDKRGIQKYLTKAYAYLKKNTLNKEEKKEQILRQYETLALKFERKGDSLMAYKYRLQRDKILGLGQENIDITSGGKVIRVIVPGEENED